MSPIYASPTWGYMPAYTPEEDWATVKGCVRSLTGWYQVSDSPSELTVEDA